MREDNKQLLAETWKRVDNESYFYIHPLWLKIIL